MVLAKEFMMKLFIIKSRNTGEYYCAGSKYYDYGKCMSQAKFYSTRAAAQKVIDTVPPFGKAYGMSWAPQEPFIVEVEVTEI